MQKHPKDMTKAEIEQKLAEAKANLAAWERRWENYDGNNPNKFRADIKIARGHVASWEMWLAQKEREGAEAK